MSWSDAAFCGLFVALIALAVVVAMRASWFPEDAAAAGTARPSVPDSPASATARQPDPVTKSTVTRAA